MVKLYLIFLYFHCVLEHTAHVSSELAFHTDTDRTMQVFAINKIECSRRFSITFRPEAFLFPSGGGGRTDDDTVLGKLK